MWRSLVALLSGGQAAAGSNPAIPTYHHRMLLIIASFVAAWTAVWAGWWLGDCTRRRRIWRTKSGRKRWRLLLYRNYWPYELRSGWVPVWALGIHIRYGYDYERWPWSWWTRRKPFHGFKAIVLPPPDDGPGTG